MDGISHNEHEYATDEDIIAGLNRLAEVANRLCNGDLEPVPRKGNSPRERNGTFSVYDVDVEPVLMDSDGFIPGAPQEGI